MRVREVEGDGMCEVKGQGGKKKVEEERERGDECERRRRTEKGG